MPVILFNLKEGRRFCRRRTGEQRNGGGLLDMNKRQGEFLRGSEVWAGVGVASAAALGLLLLGCSTGTDWEAKRAEALNRQREVIYNNDGNEPYLWPTNQPFSIAAFLDMRTTPVLGSQVDSVFYCPISSGFGFLSANIPSADLMLRDLGTVQHLAGKKNVLQNFLDMGTDPVREVVSWCRTNRLEVFVTLRVNDTHDQGTDQTKVGHPYAYPGNALYSPFKIRHPEYLMGSCTNRPPYCSWSAVDFTRGAVRERFFKMCRDVCAHYDADGLDLDFFRHMQLFKSVAWGGTASDGERALMTALMRRVRAAAEAEGKKRGRPILLSARVPDSASFCRDVGIDLETWLREGLLDMVVTSGYWRHNPWQYTADLCRRYNVKCYASLDESRLGKTVAPSLNRQTAATYRARVMAARQAGLEGVMYFNLFSPAQIRAFMQGNPERMRLDDKSYFVSYRGWQKGANRYVKGAERHFVLPELSVISPAQIAPGKACAFPVWIGDDIEALSQADIRPRCELLLDVAVPEGTALSVTVNGHVVTGEPVDSSIRRYPLRLDCLVCGENRLGFSVAEGKGLKAVTLRDAGIFLTGFPKAKR